MKKIIIILTILFSFFASLKAQSDDPKTWKYFSIMVNENDEQVFKNLSNDLFLGLNYRDEYEIEFTRGAIGDYAFGGVYQIIANLKDENPINWYLLVSDVSKLLENNTKTTKYPWFQLSKNTQEGLLNWTKSNKVNLDNKAPETEVFNDPKTWKHFKILARFEDDIIFDKIQDDMGISPKLESYTMSVNISDESGFNNYVVLGDEDDENSQKYAWSQISSEVQKGLLNWDRPNKENLTIYENYQSKVDLYTYLITNNKGNPYLYYLYYLRGLYYSKIKDYKNAISDYNKSLELNSEFVKIYLKMGAIYNIMDKYVLAVENYSKYLEVRPENLSAYRYRGEMNYELGNYKEAIKDFKYLINKDPDQYSHNYYNYYIKAAEEKLEKKK